MLMKRFEKIFTGVKSVDKAYDIYSKMILVVEEKHREELFNTFYALKLKLESGK